MIDTEAKWRRARGLSDHPDAALVSGFLFACNAYSFTADKVWLTVVSALHQRLHDKAGDAAERAPAALTVVDSGADGPLQCPVDRPPGRTLRD